MVVGALEKRPSGAFSKLPGPAFRLPYTAWQKKPLPEANFWSKNEVAQKSQKLPTRKKKLETPPIS